VCAWYETSNIEKFDRDGSPSLDAAAVVGLATVCEAQARAGALDLEVAYGTLGIDGRESRRIALGADDAMKAIEGMEERSGMRCAVLCCRTQQVGEG
jgi:hypothetical protein